MNKILNGFIFLSVVIVAPLANAQEDFFGDINVVVEESRTSDKAWSLVGWVREKVSYGLQAPDPIFSRSEKDWSKLETHSFARLDWQVNHNTAIRLSATASVDAIYQLKGEEGFSNDEVDEFERRVELKDAYIETQFGDGQQGSGIYLKAGQQIIGWGEAENLRITDLINTENQFTFGQQDLENLRLPVPALRLNYALNDFLFDAVVTYKAGTNDVAPAFDEFDPNIGIRSLGLGDVKLIEDNPKEDHEFFLRLSGHYSHGDWGMVMADANQNAFDARSFVANTGEPVKVTLNQDRFKAIGGNINWTQGSWLAFSELGVHFDKRLQPNTNQLLLLSNGWPEKDQALVAVGLSYSGLRSTTISVEADYIHTLDYDQGLAVDRRQLGYSTRLIWNGFNERLQLVAVWNQLPDQGGQIGRVTLDYDWSDSIELGLLWVTYRAEQGSPLYNYRHNDSLQLQFEYSFQR